MPKHKMRRQKRQIDGIATETASAYARVQGVRVVDGSTPAEMEAFRKHIADLRRKVAPVEACQSYGGMSKAG